MATTAATTQSVPAHIAARIAARQTGALASSGINSAIVGSGDYQFPKISIRAGRYRLVEDGVETPVGINLDVIIVGANPKVSKIFYSKPYDGAADGVRPDCFSNDGVRPDPSVENPIASGCADCQNNVLGSKVTPSGAKSKLCADQRHLAVVPAADPNKVYALTIAVSAMKNLREYLKELQNFGVEAQEVVTELGFDEQVSFPKVTFKRSDKGGGFIPEKAMKRIDDIVASDEVKVAVRLSASKSAALTAPGVVGRLASPEPEPETPAAETPAAPAAEPSAAKSSKPKAEPVKASSELESKLDSLFAE